MLSRIREAPFLPKLASPSVQTSYDIDRSQTSYNEQFQGHIMDRRPRNYSVEHHAKHRKDFALSHPEDPKDHYKTSTMSVTSPDRCSDLSKVVRPAAYPHEISEPVRTSRFEFRTTNEELFSSKKPAQPSLLEEQQKDREEIRARRMKAKAGSLRFDAPAVDDKTSRTSTTRNDLKKQPGQSEWEDRWMLTTKQSDERKTQSQLNAAKERSQNNNEFRPLPFAFPDEIQLDHSHLGLDAGVITSYHSNSTSVREFWSRGAAERKNVLSPPRALHCALPSISLAYAATPKPCDHCGSSGATNGRRSHQSSRASNTGRASVMQSMYQVGMSDPLRSRSSLF
ncbi:Hypothetical protein, putative [Bodo saltans]|uniref:Uncharacterized protein n=1 Tax=Bodo saltans TaxID=75058 RepID=A0A0S4ISW8_BODSA|nr:Hypothetical protein, putative [Bodo saltans]|eukprot:CUF73765.1 Hypothetical protein, putative [Bodo saltans]